MLGGDACASFSFGLGAAPGRIENANRKRRGDEWRVLNLRVQSRQPSNFL